MARSRSRRSCPPCRPWSSTRPCPRLDRPVIVVNLGWISDVRRGCHADAAPAPAARPARCGEKPGLDRLGRKRMLSSFLCPALSRVCAARAQDITQLIVLRLVQGAAAGGLMALAMAAVGDLVGAARARPLPGLHRSDVRRRDHRRAAARRRCWSRARAGAGCSSSTCRSALVALVGLRLRLPAPARRAARSSRSTCLGAGTAGGGDERADAGVHLGRSATPGRPDC